ncbi:MAG TPA: VWA domain-containing protein [Patescibacteria group bacterium]|nr:VWA domain-containing protein [Patescibacteria group bacterium]
MSGLHLANPWMGAVALALLTFVAWRVLRARRHASLIFSDTRIFRSIPPGLGVRVRHLPTVLRLLGLALLAVALARPQTWFHEEEVLTEGIDIVIALDVSGSMRTEDFRPKNRLLVAKDVVSKFVRGRRNDLIGLVAFAANAYTRCPATLDYGVLQDLLERTDFATREEDGTAIGMGLATAASRLKDVRGKSKVIILLTDGRNNRGQIDPLTGARLAQALGIKVYTVGIGKEGEAPYPIDDPLMGRRYIMVQADIDEDVLKQIADATGGQYFRATDSESLRSIFDRIDRMEKSEIRVRGYDRHAEKFAGLLYPGALLIGLEILLGATLTRRIP